MTRLNGGIQQEGPRFFGRMTASVSHEIKNVLAIINENAGLIEDVTLMADQGQPLEPGRLRRISGNILAQVRRADAIVRNLNRFAHSVDNNDTQVSLNETVDLMLALAARFAANRGIRLDRTTPGGATCALQTDPFLLELLLWRCLDLALQNVDDEKVLRVTCEDCPGGCRVVMAGLTLSGERGALPAPLDDELPRLLAAAVSLDESAGTMMLTLRT